MSSSELTRPEFRIISDLVAFMLWMPRVYPADLTPSGGQIPLFLGPCFYCGEGWVTHLPCPCPSCGIPLRRMIRPPLWVRGPRTYRLWRRWIFIKLDFWESNPFLLHMTDISSNLFNKIRESHDAK